MRYHVVYKSFLASQKAIGIIDAEFDVEYATVGPAGELTLLDAENRLLLAVPNSAWIICERIDGRNGGIIEG